MTTLTCSSNINSPDSRKQPSAGDGTNPAERDIPRALPLFGVCDAMVARRFRDALPIYFFSSSACSNFSSLSMTLMPFSFIVC